MTPAKPAPSLPTATSAAQAKAFLRKRPPADDAAFTRQAAPESAQQPASEDAQGEAGTMNVGDSGGSYQAAQASVPSAGVPTGAAASPPAAPVVMNTLFDPLPPGVGMLTGAATTTAAPAAPAAAIAPAVPVPVAIPAAPAVPDTIAPTLAITSNKAAVKAGETATVTFTFSEAPVGFAAGDIGISGGTLSNPTVSTTDPKVYTATFTPTAGVDAANGSITVAPGRYTDAAGNSGGAGTMPALAIDTLAPAALVINTDAPNILNGNVNNPNSVVWGNFESGATVTLTFGGTTHATSVLNDFWYYNLTPADIATMGQGAETLTAIQTDAAGNTSAPATHNFMVDTIAPIVSYATTSVNVAENSTNAAIVFGAHSEAGVTYAHVGPDAFQFNIDAATGVLSFKSSPNFEFAVDAGADNVYDVTITATDAAGNTSAQAVQVHVTDVPETNRAGDAVIDLGMYGKLIAPVQVEGKWYYFWDKNGSGTAGAGATQNGGFDFMTHNVLDDLFNHDINGVLNTTVMNNADGRFGTTDTYRYATINGVKLALPTAGGVIGPNGSSNYYPGTAVSDGASNNPTYDDLLAIWDAYNGTGTGLLTSGTPPGWPVTSYWSASVGNQLGHAMVGLTVGSINGIADAVDGYVILQVL